MGVVTVVTEFVTRDRNSITTSKLKMTKISTKFLNET